MENKLFSLRGSYTALKQDKDSISILSLHGKSKGHQAVMDVRFYKDEKQINGKLNVDLYQAEFINDIGSILFYMDNKGNIKIVSSIETLKVEIDINPKGNFEYNNLIRLDNKLIGVVNSYKSLSYYFIHASNNKMELQESIGYDTSGSTSYSESKSTFVSELNDQDYLIIEESLENFRKPLVQDLDLNEIKEENKKFYQPFYLQNPHLEKEAHSKHINEAIRILLSNTVHPSELLTVEGIIPSIESFPSIYSWDNGFIALGAATFDKELAFNQLKAVLDHISPIGQLPSSVSDTTIRWNYTKPPTIGHAILNLLEYNEFEADQLLYLHEKLNLLINYYLVHRKSDDKYAFFYLHGNDSGMDNSTVFDSTDAIESPDLSAYIVLSIEALTKIEQLLKDQNIQYVPHNYSEVKKDILNDLIEYFYMDNQFVARKQISGKIIHSDSIILMMPILVDLDSDIIDNLVNTIEKDFLSEFGLATEKLKSKLYASDSYWRGAIWAPSTSLVVSGLERHGYHDLAHRIMTSYCKMVEENGFYENYEATTGTGLRSNYFSWTAGIYLYFKNKIS